MWPRGPRSRVAGDPFAAISVDPALPAQQVKPGDELLGIDEVVDDAGPGSVAQRSLDDLAARPHSPAPGAPSADAGDVSRRARGSAAGRPACLPRSARTGSTLDRATCDLHADDTNVKLRIRVGPTPGEQEPHLDGAKPTASALVVVRVCHFCSACLPRASGL